MRKARPKARKKTKKISGAVRAVFSCRFSEDTLFAEEEAPTRDNHPLSLKWNPSTPWCHALKHDPVESDGEPKNEKPGSANKDRNNSNVDARLDGENENTVDDLYCFNTFLF